MNKPLLYDFFKEVRNDFQLAGPGVEEYLLLFQLMESGNYPISTFDELAFTLETMWVKSEAHKEKFRKLLLQRKQLISDFAELLKKEINNPEPKELAGNDNEAQTTVTGSTASVGNDNSISNNNINTNIDNNTANTNTKVTAINKNNEVLKTKQDDDIKIGEVSFSFGNSEEEIRGFLKFDKKAEASKPLHEIPYLFTNDYFPVKNRQLQQAWRILMSRKKGDDSTVMDISKTIEHTAKQGYFSSFVYEKNILNQLQLFIFLDQSESMIAMEDFGDELYNAANEGGLHQELEPSYFYKIPVYDHTKDDYVLTNEDGTKLTSFKKLFSKLNRKNIVVLIYSDAGALKNEFDIDERIPRTKEFIKRLHQQTGYIAWVNPASKNRWKETNAEEIAKDVPMFETSRSDIENAIAALKGKLTVKK